LPVDDIHNTIKTQNPFDIHSSKMKLPHLIAQFIKKTSNFKYLILKQTNKQTNTVSFSNFHIPQNNCNKRQVLHSYVFLACRGISQQPNKEKKNSTFKQINH
jgi:hypothetical protein